MKSSVHFRASLIRIGIAVWLAPLAAAGSSIEVIAIDGQAAPVRASGEDGGQFYFPIGEDLGNDGSVILRNSASAISAGGLYSWKQGRVVRMVSEGDPGLNPGEEIRQISPNTTRQSPDGAAVVFQGTVLSDEGFFSALFFHRDGVLQEIVRTGDAAPGLGSTFRQFDPHPRAVRNDGTVLFEASLEGSGSGLFQWQSGVLTSLLQDGDSLGGGTVDQINFNGSAQMNDSGTVAGVCRITRDSGVSVDAVFKVEQGTASILLEEGGPTEPTETRISSLSDPRVSPSGTRIMASAAVNGVEALYEVAGGRPLKVVDENQALPGGGGFSSFEPHRVVTDSGRLFFHLRGFFGPNGAFDEGIFSAAWGELIRNELRAGDAAPGTSSSFTGASDLMRLGPSGHLLVEARLADGRRGFWVKEPDGDFIKVVATGDALAGGVVTNLYEIETIQEESNTRMLNDRGQVMFNFEIDGARYGLAVWSPDGVVPLEPREVSIARDGGGVVTLEFPTSQGRSYGIEAAADLGSFLNVATMAGTGLKMSWTDDGSLTGQAPAEVDRRFYRIVGSD